MTETSQKNQSGKPEREQIEEFTSAAACGDIFAVRQFIASWPKSIDAKDEKSWTALMHAARNGHENIVKALLDSGADREIQDRWGRSAWVLARGNRHKAIMGIIRPSRNTPATE